VLFNKFFPLVNTCLLLLPLVNTCLSCEDSAGQWCPDVNFLHCLYAQSSHHGEITGK